MVFGISRILNQLFPQLLFLQAEQVGRFALGKHEGKPKGSVNQDGVSGGGKPFPNCYIIDGWLTVLYRLGCIRLFSGFRSEFAVRGCPGVPNELCGQRRLSVGLALVANRV